MDAADRFQAPLAGLASRYGLDRRRHGQLALLLELLEGEARSPTSVRDVDRAADVHIADSLVALDLDQVRSATTIADLGSGAGFPGLVLAIVLPGSRVCLVESQQRKCAFLEQMIVHVGITNARVVHARAEEWRAGMGEHDLVVARALAPQPVVMEYAAPLLWIGGALLDWRGKRVAAEEDAARGAAAELGLHRVDVRRVEPFEGARDHHLHLFVKSTETPERYPRRAGMARKRPLGV